VAETTTVLDLHLAFIVDESADVAPELVVPRSCSLTLPLRLTGASLCV
jgi:hypothetical protein